MKLRFYLICLALLLGSQTSLIQAQDTFDRRAMLDNIVNNVILSGYETFIEQATILEEATMLFSDAPTIDNLEQVQEAWRNTSNAWEEVAFYGIGLSLMSLHNQVDKRPVNVSIIERLLENTEIIDEAFVESIGSTQKGLPALEYFIFDSDDDNQVVVDALTSDSQQMDFIVALAQYLPTTGENILLYWSAEGDNFAENFINADQAGGDPQGSINLLANEMFAAFEMILQMRIGEPAGIVNGGEAHPGLVDAPLSQHSLARVEHTLIGLQRLFTGGSTDALGFDDYLDFLNAEYEGQTLSSHINERFEATLATLNTIDEPLQTAVVNQADAVQTLYDEIRMTLIPIRVDMASQLSILVTFSDADGDG